MDVKALSLGRIYLCRLPVLVRLRHGQLEQSLGQ
jgi:hypothetical protein